MLRKLIGYEMKAFGRIILPLYAATIGMSLLIGLGVRFLPEDAYSNWIGGIIIMIFSTLIIATMVMTGVLCVQRFYQNLLANEGYLMFSLPVGTHQLILSKVLGSLIWSALGGLTGAATVAVMSLAAVPFDQLAEGFREFFVWLDRIDLSEGLVQVVVWGLIAVLSFAATLMQIYCALAIGHQWNAHRILGSVLAYFGIDIAKNTVSGILSNIGVRVGLFGFMIDASEAGATGAAPLQISLTISLLILIVVYSLVTWYLLDRKLNLE